MIQPATTIETPTPDLLAHYQHNACIVSFLNDSVIEFADVLSVATDLEQIVDSMTTPNLILDMDGLSRCTSMILNVLLEIRSMCEDRGGTLCLANVGGFIQEVFRITKMNGKFRFYASVEQASLDLRQPRIEAFRPFDLN